MRRLVGQYIKKNSFILFVYDCSDNERLEEALIELQSNIQMMRDADSRYLWILLNKQDLLSPAKRHQVTAEIRQRFQTLITLHSDVVAATVVDLPGLSSKTGTQLKEVLDIIQKRLTVESAESISDVSSEIEAIKASPDAGIDMYQQNLLRRVQKSNSTAEDADTFWVAFESGQLETWDHYNHLRAGYFVLLESLTFGRGVVACSNLFIEHLERLRANNPQRFRNTTHQTMTVFWIVQLWYCTKTYQAANHMQDLPQRENFCDILLQSPSLMDSQLWKQFYSKELMFSPEAKHAWCPPTLRPFPAVLQLEKGSFKVEDRVAVRKESIRLLKFGFDVARNILQSSKRRGIIVKEALESLQTLTIQRRTQNPSIPPYSETQAYFWIQIAHAALRSVYDNGADISNIDFSQFRKTFAFTETAWHGYYSTDLWESIPARMSFVNPDLKPLPNIVRSLPEAKASTTTKGGVSNNI